MYWEGFVLTVNGNASWDAGAHHLVLRGAPNMPTCHVVTSQVKKGNKVIVSTENRCTK